MYGVRFFYVFALTGYRLRGRNQGRIPCGQNTPVGVAVVPYLKRVGDRDQWGTPLPLIEHRGKYYLFQTGGTRGEVCHSLRLKRGTV